MYFLARDAKKWWKEKEAAFYRLVSVQQRSVNWILWNFVKYLMGSEKWRGE